MIALGSYARLAVSYKWTIGSLSWVSYYLVLSLRSALHLSRWSIPVAIHFAGDLGPIGLFMTMAYWSMISRFGNVLLSTEYVRTLATNCIEKSKHGSVDCGENPLTGFLLSNVSRFRRVIALGGSFALLVVIAFFQDELQSLLLGSIKVGGAILTLSYLIPVVYLARLWWLLGELTPRETPRAAAYLADLLLPYKRAEALIGDLEERFPRKCGEVGVVRARCWYWRQVMYSLLPVVWAGWEIIRRIIK